MLELQQADSPLVLDLVVISTPSSKLLLVDKPKNQVYEDQTPIQVILALPASNSTLGCSLTLLVLVNLMVTCFQGVERIDYKKILGVSRNESRKKRKVLEAKVVVAQDTMLGSGDFEPSCGE